MKPLILAAAILCLPSVADAACLSRSSIQQKLLPLVQEQYEAANAVASGAADADDRWDEAERKSYQVLVLLRQWQKAPNDVRGCNRRGK